MLRPEDLVTVGWLPPAWEPAGMRLLRRDGAEAEVEVYLRGRRPPGDPHRPGRQDLEGRAPVSLTVGDRRAGRRRRARAGADLGLLDLFHVVFGELDDDLFELGQPHAGVGVGVSLAGRAAPLAHAALAREDALVDLLALAAVGVAPLAAQGVAQLLDGVGHLGHAQDLRGAAVAEREAAPFELDQPQLIAALLLADGARRPAADRAATPPSACNNPSNARVAARSRPLRTRHTARWHARLRRS